MSTTQDTLQQIRIASPCSATGRPWTATTGCVLSCVRKNVYNLSRAARRRGSRIGA